MARQPDIRYVQIYNPGSTAKKLEVLPRQQKKNAAPPKPKAEERSIRVIHVDPMALCAMAAAGVLLIAMVVGMIRLGTAESRTQELEQYASVLQQENVALREAFQGAYDPETVQNQAKLSGMIPAEEAERVSLELTIPQQAEEPGFFEKIGLFFSELFA
jgi:hypothetical protein